MSITHIPCTNQAFIKDMNLPLMSSWVWRRQGFLALYRANWDETFAFTFSSSKLLRSSTSIQKLVLNAGANLRLPATSSRVFSSSSETLVFSGSSGMLKMMLCCFDKHTKRSSARKLDTKKKYFTSKPPKCNSQPVRNRKTPNTLTLNLRTLVD